MILIFPLVFLVFKESISISQILKPIPRAGIGDAYSETNPLIEDRLVPPFPSCGKKNYSISSNSNPRILKLNHKRFARGVLE